MRCARLCWFVLVTIAGLGVPVPAAGEDTPLERLAEALVDADGQQAREALLSAEPELATVELRKTLSSQGDERATKGDYAGAAVRYEAALTVAGQVGDEVGAIESLNDLGRVHRYQGRYDRALEVLGEALRRSEAREHKGWIAATVNSLGNIHNMRGEYEDAVRYYERGLALSEELGLPHGVASTLVNLASIHSGQGDYPRATERLQRCLEIAEGTGNRPVLALALLNLGHVHRDLGEHETALEHLRRGLAIREELGNTSDIAAAHALLGDALLAQGDYARALDHYHRSLSIAEPSGEKARTASALHSIGLVYRAQGDLGLAKDFLRRSLALTEELGNRTRIAALLLDLARVSLEDGHVAEAQGRIDRSLALSEAAGDRVAAAAAGIERGEVQRRHGDAEQALSSFRASLATSEALGHRAGVASAWQRIGLLHLECGHPGQAAEALDRARDVAREIHARERLWESSAAAGRAYRALGRSDQAQQAFAEAIATIEDLRADVAGGEAERQRFFESRVAPYQGMVALLVEQGRLPDALVFAERGKARALLDAMRGDRSRPSRALTAEEREREGRLRTAVVSLNVQLAREAQRVRPGTARLADLTARLEKARREHDDYQTRLDAAHPALRVERGEAPPFDLHDAARLLEDGRTVVLEYAVREDRALLFVLTRGSANADTPAIQLHDLGAGAAALRRQVRELTQRIANRDLDLGAPASRLYDLLVRPAEAAIRGKDRVILVPDDVLWELPFQALRPAGGRYLVEAAAVSYAPSLAVLRDMKRAARSDAGSGTLLAMGNPAMAEPVVSRARAVARGASLGPLPDAEREVRTLGRLYGPGTTKTYVGADAREDVLKAEAGRHRILHLATHGVLNDASPLYSYVLLSRGDEAKEDGLLEAREIMGLDLRADLAVLSACETARGRFGAGEGIVGLSWALFVAGCETTVVSQWKVASESTGDLMVEFHRRLRAGVRKDEALRRAALKLLADRRYRHPFYWAGFIVVGDAD